MSTVTPARPRPRPAAARTSTASPRQRFINVLLLTVIAGTCFSVLNSSAATTAFRSRLPAHTLTRLEDTAFPLPKLPFFGDKRNILNQWFVKRSWAWVTAVYVLLSVTLLAFPASAPSSQRASAPSTTPAIVNGRAVPSTELAVPTGHLYGSLRRYLLASLYWFYLTQATWFGRSLGPSITLRILRSSGAVCVPSAVSNDPLSAHAAHSGLESTEPGHAAAGAPLVCTGAKGEYWRGGHDVSGHAFMMVHCSLFLLELVYPLLPALFPALFSNGTRSEADRVRRTHPIIVLAGYAAVFVIILSWWMLLMTSLFFHTPMEKLTGAAFGFLGWYVSGL
ncbi:hypothetical protein Rhopal_003950-T1 [Rhodotorula paludigena]|uniref:Inositol phospholipid synthesis and fat-storage-inducing TM-domain-containing protein n=1 Tax=Rhodotorula paludigena TaxID=86838 RepID=A0AAV5GEU2_9BASI|nr:hypothetical protein Rhopal_003950-T1 [Rhodotorula paludigena]